MPPVKKLIDTSNLELDEAREPLDLGTTLKPPYRRVYSKTEWSEQHVLRTRDTDDKHVVTFIRTTFSRPWNDETGKREEKPVLSQWTHTTTSQKFLCVGGLYNGKKMVAQPDYELYNRAAFSRGRSEKNRPPHKVVQIFKELLK